MLVRDLSLLDAVGSSVPLVAGEAVALPAGLN